MTFGAEQLAALRAGLDRDAEIAQAADDLQEDSGWGIVTNPGMHGITITPHIGHIHETQAAEHIIRNGPDRALRQVEAIRKVIAIAEQMMEYAAARDRVSPRAEKILLALTDIYPDTTETGEQP